MDVDAEMLSLATMSSAGLRDRWVKLTGRPCPKVSPSMLRLAISYELQAKLHGGLTRRTSQKLDQLASNKSETRDVRPGMRLVREWNGVLHIVTVDDDGTLLWRGERWDSLSQIARTITGTRWSGPAFFGLKQTKKAAA